MNYIGLNQSIRQYKSAAIQARRDVSFILTDPGSWNTEEFLEILWQHAGGIIESVELFNSFRSETGEVTHTYRVWFRCKNSGSKAGLGFPVEKVNALVVAIENDLEKLLKIRFISKHTLGRKNGDS